MLQVRYTAQFERDVKKLAKKHVKLEELYAVVDLILQDSSESVAELRRRHGMHQLAGVWRGSFECHVANAGDWLLIWKTGNGLAVLMRTGTHDELFR